MTLRKFWAEGNFPLDVEWIVVDNGSADGSVAFARSRGARVIPLEKNLGFGAANNVGFKASKGDYVAFVNPDVTVTLSSLSTLEAVLDASTALVSPQLINPDGTLQPNGRGAPFLVNKILNRLSSTGPSSYQICAGPGQILPVTWFMGAAVVGKRHVLETLGPWDERFFVYYEDSDLGLRASARGIPSLVVGDVQWVHGWARETKRLSWKAWKRELPSAFKFYSRYPYLLSPIPRQAKPRLREVASK